MGVSRGLLLLCVLLLFVSLQLDAQQATAVVDTKENPPKTRLKNQDETPAKSKTGLFDSHELLKLKLVKNCKIIKKDIGANRRYHPAVLAYTDSDGNEIKLQVLVRTRGKKRRDPQLCNWPPLFLKFKDPATENTIFRGQTKLKLVTHCQKRDRLFEQYILLEYLVYRIYNILTPRSFRVRLARVQYIDEEGKIKPYEKYAFFIERTKYMARRNNATLEKSGNRYLKFRDFDAQILHSVFQFFIGNTDWSISARHNIKIIKSDAAGNGYLYAVPYDFDYSGFVNTPYAAPHVSVRDRIRRVRNRLFLGLCRTPEEFDPTFALFKEKKDAIYSLVKDFSLLNSKHRRYSMHYIRQFYKIIDSPRFINKHFIDNCEKIKKGKKIHPKK